MASGPFIRLILYAPGENALSSRFRPSNCSPPPSKRYWQGEQGLKQGLQPPTPAFD
jgi:hypothetical protein